jgi:hypothetical protein
VCVRAEADAGKRGDLLTSEEREEIRKLPSMCRTSWA